MNIDIPFVASCLACFILGFVARGFYGRDVPLKNEILIANAIGWGWILWTFVLAPFTGIDPPSTTVDIISGGALGVIMGEKFFEYVAKSLSSFKK